MLFYNDWPLGYHNVEAERKARAFARAGYEVSYVAGLGVRNPRPARAARAADLLFRALRDRGARGLDVDPDGLRRLGLFALPPRQVGAVRALNERAIARRLTRELPAWSDSGVAWVRFATPELVGALSRARPRSIVYEATDAHWRSPQLMGRWSAVFERAERQLVSLSDIVLVTSRSLAPRYQAWGAKVRETPHGVDLTPWVDRKPRSDVSRAALGFIGTLDYRLDASIIRHVAVARPHWQVRLIGPVESGFDPAALADLPNVTVEPPVAHAQISAALAELDVAFMPYAMTPLYEHGFPLKALEAFAVGLPVVVRPNENVDPLGSLVYRAETPGDFLRETERALRTDTPTQARTRREFVEGRTWTARLQDLVDLLDDLRAGPA